MGEACEFPVTWAYDRSWDPGGVKSGKDQMYYSVLSVNIVG